MPSEKSLFIYIFIIAHRAFFVNISGTRDCVKFFPHIFFKNLIFLFFNNIPQKSAYFVINGVKPHYTATRY